jgi:dUTP pyrophosphatase
MWIMILKVKKTHPDALIPAYAHEGDAGLDLRSTDDAILVPGEKKILGTGLAFEIPEGHAGLIWDRSGLAVKHGIHTLAGVIDSTYRGEIRIVLVNLGKEEFHVKKGERVAQMIIQPVVQTKIEETEDISETKRGERGFGSTGVH